MSFHFNYIIITCTLLLMLNVSGCSSEQFYSVQDFKSVDKVDIHVHINKTNSALAAQAAEDNFRLISVNVDLFFPNVSIEEQRLTAKGMKDLFPDQVGWLSTFEMEGWDEESWEQETIAHLAETFSEGAIGIKLWKNIGMEFRDKNGEFILIDHPRFKPVIDFVESQGKSVLAHIGEPREAWLPLEQMKLHRGYFSNNPQYHMYLHPEFPSYEEIIASRNNFLDMYPDLKIVGAHLGSMEWSIEMMSQHLDKYPNFALEMAARMRHMYVASSENYEKTRDFFITYQDQLMYSTDLSESPDSTPQQVQARASEVWQKDWEFFVSDNEMTDSALDRSFRGLRLPKSVIDKLYKTNAEKWFPEL